MIHFLRFLANEQELQRKDINPSIIYDPLDSPGCALPDIMMHLFSSLPDFSLIVRSGTSNPPRDVHNLPIFK